MLTILIRNTYVYDSFVVFHRTQDLEFGQPPLTTLAYENGSKPDSAMDGQSFIVYKRESVL